MEENIQQNNSGKKNKHRHFYHHNRSKQNKVQANATEVENESAEVVVKPQGMKNPNGNNNQNRNNGQNPNNNGQNPNNNGQTFNGNGKKNKHRHGKNKKFNRQEANQELREEMSSEELEKYRSSVVLNLVNEKKAEMQKQNAPAQTNNNQNRQGNNQNKQNAKPQEEIKFASSFASNMLASSSIAPDYEKLQTEEDYQKAIAQINVDELLANLDKKEQENASRPKVTVVGINFRGTGKTYYFDPNGLTLKPHDHVIVETARGMEYADVVKGNMEVFESGIVPPLKPVVRLADKNDEKIFLENLQKEKNAFPIFKEKVKECKLEMQLFDVRYAFNGSSIVFYFSADGRVDFRELVRLLAAEFHTRIELRQIGCRDEAKMLGGIGPCGRTLCCAGHLTNYLQTTVKMAKDQGLSINSAKISGTCGRLLCCLQYENEVYGEALRHCPSVGDFVKTPEGCGKVISVLPLQFTCRVSFHNKENDTDTVKQFTCSDITVLSHEKEKYDKNEGKELEGN